MAKGNRIYFEVTMIDIPHNKMCLKKLTRHVERDVHLKDSY